MYDDLAKGRVDAIFADAVALNVFLNMDAGKCCEAKGSVAHDPAILGRGVGAAVRPVDRELLQKLNIAIREVIENGTRAKITRKYFDIPIY